VLLWVLTFDTAGDLPWEDPHGAFLVHAGPGAQGSPALLQQMGGQARPPLSPAAAAAAAAGLQAFPSQARPMMGAAPPFGSFMQPQQAAVGPAYRPAQPTQQAPLQGAVQIRPGVHMLGSAAPRGAAQQQQAAPGKAPGPEQLFFGQGSAAQQQALAQQAVQQHLALLQQQQSAQAPVSDAPDAQAQPNGDVLMRNAP
jgi:hypothetical protein